MTEIPADLTIVESGVVSLESGDWLAVISLSSGDDLLRKKKTRAEAEAWVEEHLSAHASARLTSESGSCE